MKKVLTIALVFVSYFTFGQNDYDFKIIKDVETTAVKNQQSTGTCWSFSSASFVESELMRLGKGEFDISEMYVARKIYVEKALNYVRRQGKAQFGEGSLAHDLLLVIDKYGIVPESVYDGRRQDGERHNHSEMVKMLKSILDIVVAQNTPSPYWLDAYEGVLDAYLGKVPETFTYNGKTHTPQSYAKEVVGINASDYIEVTSYTHHPFYKQFVLEIPDNFSNGIYYNVPIEDLEAITDNAIDKGYSMVWDCDVSEKTFSQNDGLAILPKEASSKDARTVAFQHPQDEIKVTQALRQETFDNYQTTDDHLMHITGIAKDVNGKKYYLVKNSWGERGTYKGYLYASQAYFQLKTVSILVHKSAVPKGIAEKLGL